MSGAADYDSLVQAHEATRDGIPFLHLRRPGEAAQALLVTLATHNNGHRYASLESANRLAAFDLLCLRDPDNSFYLQDDGGARFDGVVAAALDGYDPARVVFFGSSMAGYAALRWALRHDANAVVSNPQVNLDESARLAWPELRRNILHIPRRENLDDLEHGARRCAITCLHGRHPMDLENMRRLATLCLRTPGISLTLEHRPEERHAYLIAGFAHFRQLVQDTLRIRQRLPLPQAPR
ncbi:hypothetical protein [Falsiroseomonas oryzae]|uniref:hypothetical protein n=1 Tax=Falsiroseomonas oryzae TaxID=2766473 RepID=UPI0022EA85D3|nr:hypothetical protein [Roseomonas sp. MO-31]